MSRTALGAMGVCIFVLLGTGEAHAAKVKPDAYIKKDFAPFVGKRVYSPPSPVDPDQSATETGDAVFRVVVKNRGTQRDTFRIQAQGSLVDGGTRAIVYKGNDVTGAAEAGDFKLKRVAPGATRQFRIVHSSGGSLEAGATTFITATSKNNPNKSDTVRGHTPPLSP